VRILLEEIAVPNGLVLVLDDLHWADGASVEVLSHLLRHPPHGAVLIALSYRPQQVAARLASVLTDAAYQGLAQHLELRPLSVEEVDELLGPATSRSWHRSLYEASGGNPLYLEALAFLGQEAHHLLSPGGFDAKRGEVPHAVRAALGAELDALSTTGRLVARAAAVAGDPFDLQLVAEVAGIDEAEVLVVIDELLHHDLVRQSSSPREFCYRHPLVRHVVYTTTRAGWRLAAHARAAAALAARGSSVVTLASHVERAARSGDERAIAVLVEAARTVMPHAPAAAAHWLETALGLLPRTGEATQRRLELLLGLARALGAAGRLHESRNTLHEVLTLMPSDQTERRGEATAVCAMVERLLGRHNEARQMLLGEFTSLPDGDKPGAAMLKLELAAGSLLLGDDDAANYASVQEELAVAKASPDPSLRATAWAADILARCTVGAIDQATLSLSEATGLVDSLPDGDLIRRLDVFVWLGWGEIYLERYEQALRHLTRGLAIGRVRGQNSVLPRLLTAQGSLYGLLGRLAEAADCADDALEAAVLSGSEELLRMALTMQCRNAVLAGDVEAALQAGKRATTAGSIKSRWWRFAWVALAEAHLAAGDAQNCISAIEFAGGGPELPAIFIPTRPQACELLTRAELALGRTQRAAAWANHTQVAAAGLGLAGASAFASLARAEVLLAGDPHAAANAALSAAAAFTELGNRIDAGRAHLVAGSALAADRQYGDAAAELRDAEMLFAACEARALSERSIREQQRLDVRARDPQGTLRANGLTALTGRELEVADLVSQGQTNHQIARRLSVSHKTVEAHLAHIFTKLDVSSRAAVASKVAQAKAWGEASKVDTY
jgi:ATP/maltotriose-dependent transcriptional regulator MalT